MPHEEALSGGNASGAVVRIGDTVRKPWTASTPSVTAYVHALRAAGIDAPEPRGRDEAGRQVLEYVPGELALMHGTMAPAELGRVGAMVRAIHDASARWTPPEDSLWESAIPAPASELVCHNDLAPWNLMMGERWVFIDWDAAAPSTRLWDLAYAAQAFALNDASADPADAVPAFAAFVDGYDADDELRDGLPDAMAERAAAMHDLLRRSHAAGVEPWALMFTAGHGDHWASVSDYVRSHRETWTDALRR
ncbi:phosphotransferase [Microbacterium oleivorans]|uniref:phosphotransferase n=1 Tax=Microbacterium oleivorans TaxID=273677 RepID=UPI000766EE9F|nr:phosphotransferase [Microbacterium oleivorans]